MIPSALYRLSDLAMVTLLPSALLYEDGFGDREALEALVEIIRSHDIEAESEAIELRWEGPAVVRGEQAVRRGWFRSPVAHLLPPEVRRAPIELVSPVHQSDDLRPVYVMLGATGEEGFQSRRPLAAWLAGQGVASLMLENAFYGARRPRGQQGPHLRTVEDQFAMNLGTVDEARALLRWLRDQGHGLVGITGYSQGGVMAAFGAALSPFVVAAVPRGAGDSSAPIFTTAALSRRIAWSRLADELGGLTAAREYLGRCLEPVRLSRFRPPRAPEAAVLVHARGDGFVPPEEAEALHGHWAGSELRWLEGGHVTMSLFHRRAQRQALLDALAVARRLV